MKYRIIWIDDSPKWVRSVRDDLVEIFESKSFDLEIEEFERVGEARVAIESNYVDLILVDCNLPDNTSGDKFISELRTNRCFAHIVFYSYDAKNLQLLIEDKHFLHITHRNDIFDTLESVSEQAYRKYHHPAFMRGLLLSEFIDLENLMEDLVVQCFKGEGDYFRDTIINKGGENYSLAAKLKFIRRLLKEVLEADSSRKSEIDDIAFSSNQFQKKIMDRRNILAHAYPKYDDKTGEIALISSFPVVDFNSDWFHETRDEIYKHKNKLRKIYGLELINIINP